MALKRNLSESEQYGLTQEEIKLATQYLRKNKTAGQVPKESSYRLYDLYIIGYTFQEINTQFPQFSIPQIILTAALNGWVIDREKCTDTLKKRVGAKVAKTVLDQIDFLTTMFGVVSAANMDTMRKYIADPKNNPMPAFAINNIKDYKDMLDTLYKIVVGTVPDKPSKKSSLFDAIENARDPEDRTKNGISKPDDSGTIDYDPAKLIEAEVSSATTEPK